jgi:hypothetical protein
LVLCLPQPDLAAIPEQAVEIGPEHHTTTVSNLGQLFSGEVSDYLAKNNVYFHLDNPSVLAQTAAGLFRAG